MTAMGGLRLRLATPRAAGEGRVRLVFTRLDPEARWEPAAGTEPTEKYGASSAYQRISKPEDPGFVLDMADALERIVLPAAPTILDLGVNTGDELALLQALRPELRAASLIGIDHSASAIAKARGPESEADVTVMSPDMPEMPRYHWAAAPPRK